MSATMREVERRETVEPRVLEATLVATASKASGLPAPAHPTIVFAGRSNVGKSSLLNAMLGRRNLARTSKTPGCTRTLNLFRARLAGDAVVDLLDLPGYGYAARSHSERVAWGRAIEQMLSTRAGLDVAVVLVDARRGIEDDDAGLLALLRARGLETLVVATKVDKLAASRKAALLAAIGRAHGTRVIGFSAPSGEGRDQLWRRLLDAVKIRLGGGV